VKDSQQKIPGKVSRRRFLKRSTLAGAGFLLVPRAVLGGRGFLPPSEKVNIAVVGVGGRGAALVNAVAEHNLVAFCDVDDKRAARTYERFPKVPRYRDFRVMLERHPEIEAVMVATPDHTHAVIAMTAMRHGKHVYVEKPLTHNLKETRLLTETARAKGLITQMGNQGASGEGVRQIMEWIDAGLIGTVHRVHCWTNRPIWPQGVPTPTGEYEVPETLDWDRWLGPAAWRPYNPAYLPFKWRGWWDFGTGALGDMGCHIMDPPVKALRLGYPEAVEASAGQVYIGDFLEADYVDSCPPSSKIHFFFPQRGELPPVELVWYDGGILPRRPDELLPNEPMGETGGGCIFEGTEGKIMCGVYGRNPTLLPTRLMKEVQLPEPSLPRVETSHQLDWVNAIKEKRQPSSHFDYAGKLTEIVLMGNLAIRSYNIRVLKPGKKRGDWAPYDYPGRIRLLWDGDNMRITNFEPANEFVFRQYRPGWEELLKA